MPILQLGAKLPSTYLERFNPPENTVLRVSVLAVQTYALQAHWLDYPYADIRGMYKCTHGVCCQAFGAPSSSYHLPVFVYTNPTQNTEGTLMDWSLSKSLYNDVVGLAQRYNLLKYDLEVRRVKQGQGTRTSLTIVPDVCMRDYWSAEQKETIQRDVDAFFQLADKTIARDVTEQDYVQILNTLGYDFQNQCFLQGPGGARGGISYNPNAAIQGVAYHAPQVSSPVPGTAPVTPQISSQASVIPPAMSAVPTASQGIPSAGIPKTPVGSPVTPVLSSPVPPVASAQVIPQASVIPPAPRQAVPTAQPAVSPVQPAVAQPVIPQTSAPSNTLQNATEISADEIDALLD